MSFTEDWFSAESCNVLADLARTVSHLHGKIIEVGSWEGKSTVALANAVAPESVHAVDTWQGSPGEVSSRLAARRDVYSRFLENIAAFTNGNVGVHRMGWRQFFDGFDSPIKFLFIDAEHTYAEVFDLIEAARPHMVAGGIICGDDVHHPPVQQAVIDQFGDADALGTVWSWTA